MGNYTLIIFKTLTWKNFLSTGNVANELQLDSHTSTLIIGKNGEGKSTMLDALTFALFGKPFRDVNKNQLINSINKKNCMVEVKFESNNREYRIVRGIRPNIFEIYCDNELINKDAALKDYQKVLEQQILKLNYKTFTQVIILGSSSFVPFMQLPTGQRREVIEDILDIRVFSTMNSILKEKVIETKDNLSGIETKVLNERIKIESQKNLIKVLVNSKQDTITNIQQKIEANNTDIEFARSTIIKLNEEITTLKAKTVKEKDVLLNIDKAKSLKSKTKHTIDSCTNNMHFFSNNDVCPSCSQDINETHKQKVIVDLNTTIESNTNKIIELDDVIVKLQKQIDVILSITNQITDKNIDISTYNNTITILNNQIAGHTSEIAQIKLNTGDIDVEKKKLKTLAESAMELIIDKNALLEHRNLQDAALNLLKDTGIKTAIIREYLPAMNKLINKYLSAMDFFTHFELDDGFNEIIKSRHRDEFTYASFSEGEKQKIDLALLFSWRQIAKIKNSVNTNLLIMDEIFDSSLDTAGTEMLMQLLNELPSGHNVYVISHKGDQLLDKFDNTIKFEKKNEFSIISST